MSSNYDQIKQELKSKNDTFNFANTLIQQVNNDYWKNKQAVWTIISAACNEAAAEFYVKNKDFVKNLTDIDVCNIHALKSIAQSVNAEHLTDFISQNFPKELQELVNILSIKQTKLLQYNQYLHPLNLFPIYGKIDLRNCLVRPTTISKSLLLDIYENIDKIQKLFEFNNVNLDNLIRDVYSKNKTYDLMDQIWFENKAKYSDLTENDKIYFYDDKSNKINTFTYDLNTFAKYIYQDKEQDISKPEGIIQINRIINIKKQVLIGKDWNSYAKTTDIWYQTITDELAKVTPIESNIILSSLVTDYSKYTTDELNSHVSTYIYSGEDTYKYFNLENSKGVVEYVRNSNFDIPVNYTYHYLNNTDKTLMNIKLIIQNIKHIKQYIDIITNDKEINPLNVSLNALLSQADKKENVKLFLENNFTEANMIIKINNTYVLNPFFALIEIFKGLLFGQIQTQFVTYYKEKDTNIHVNLQNLCKNIIETINHYEQTYKKHFMYYHFYNLIKEMIVNDNIKNDFECIKENNKHNIIYVSKNSQYSKEQFSSLISSYMNDDDLDNFLNDTQNIQNEFSVQITHYKRSYINFIKYLYLVNSINGYETTEEITFPYKLYLYNNTFELTDIYNQKLRQMFGLAGDGSYTEKDYIAILANYLVDICLKISYIREDIKGLIQQYTFIGTQRIITDVIKDYFMKNFSKRSSWGYVSDIFLNKDNIENSPLKSISDLNDNNSQVLGKNKFQPSIIEYYDQTAYLNIITDLPNCVAGYKTITSWVESSYITTEAFVSTTILPTEVLSTILDTFPYEVPYSAISSQVKPSEGEFIIPATVLTGNYVNFTSPSSIELIPITSTGIILTPQIKVSAGLIPSAGVLTSILIPSGTQVSSNIPANTWVTTSYISSTQQPIYAPCADFIYDYNERFWERDLSNLTYNQLKDQILFYEKYFPELQRVKSKKLKLNVYKEKIYPILAEVWNTFATSGFLYDNLSSLQYQYSGQYPGKYRALNHVNKTFTTIAPLPYIPNLIQTSTYDNDDSFIIKPLYDNIAYYMNMLMTDMFNMYKNINGLGVAHNGWKQTHIEFKGYSSKYERSNNTIDNSSVYDKKIDVDGPWVYTSLKEFLKLYNLNDNYINTLQIQKFIEDYCIKLNTIPNQRLITQLLNYQHEIIRKQNYKICGFQNDYYDNQFILFKQKNHANYEDAGQIWIRMKNYPLAIPAMNNCIDITINGFNQKFLSLDTLQFNDDIRYSNMFKQMCNNAVQFGIIQNTIWILGWTNYILNNNERLITSEKQLKLVCGTFTLNETYNSLVINSLSVKSFNINEYNDIIDINNFIGVNKNNEDSIDFTLFNNNDSIVTLTKENSFDELKNTTLYTNVYNYNLENYDVELNSIKFNNTVFPAINLSTISALIDNKNLYFQSINDLLGQTFYLKTKLSNFSGTIYFIGNLYDINGEYHLIGKVVKEEYNYNVQKVYDKNLKYLGTFEAKLNIIFNQFPDILNNFKISINNIEWLNYEITIQTQVTGTLEDLIITDNNYWYCTYSLQKTDNLIFKNIKQNIWRLSQVNEQTNIAYESLNVNALDSSIINQLSSNIFISKDVKYIAYINYDCELISKQINNSDQIIFLTQIKNISANYGVDVYNITNQELNKTNLILIQEEYPSCILTNNNHLLINTIGTTLGNKKNLWVRTDDKSFSDEKNNNGANLVLGLLSDTISGAINNLSSTILLSSINYLYKTTYIEDIYQNYLLSTNFYDYDNTFGNITGNINLYNYYQDYLIAKNNNASVSDLSNILSQYNKTMESLANITNFASVVTDFLLQPMKIIFNFGDFYNENYNLKDNDNFDLDINTFINTETEKNKKVGWKCGRRSTDYIQWITYDNITGGPQITLIDLQKYKFKNKGFNNIDIIINACWFINSNLQSLNPNIIINWRGFTYHYIVQDIQLNTSCCDYPFIKINVDLLTNAVKCYRSAYIPYILNYDFNKNIYYIGYVRMYEDEIKQILTNPINIIKYDNYTIQLINQPYYTYNNFLTLYDDKNILNECGIICNKSINQISHSLVYTFDKNLIYNQYEFSLHNEKMIQIKDGIIIPIIRDNKFFKTNFNIVALENSSFRIIKHGNPTENTIYYKLNDIQYVYDFNEVVTLNKGEQVYFYGDKNTLNINQNNYYQFEIIGKTDLRGNINSLINHQETMNDYCFYKLFKDCTGIVNAIQLVLLTNLSKYCYAYMFENCQNLITTPYLIPIDGFDENDLTIVANQISTIRIIKHGNPTNCTIKYKLNGEIKEYNFNTKIVLTKNNYIQFQNNTNEFSIDQNNYYQFEIIGNVNVRGNINSLINHYNIMNDYCFYKLFKDCTGIVNALQLVLLTNLSKYCYAYMFENCQNLITTPQLIPGDIFNNDDFNIIANQNSSFRIIKHGNPTNCTFYYKLNDKQYVYNFNEIINLNKNDQVYFYGDKNTLNIDQNNYYQFEIIGNVQLKGNINSLINRYNKMNDYCFCKLFKDCTGIVNILQLKLLDNLSNHCYAYMFENCQNLQFVINIIKS